MYNVDPTLLDRIKSKSQDINPQTYITRNKTSINAQRFWEEVTVTPTVGTRSSIAVRRPEGNLTCDMIFVAQVESGDAIIRKAEPKPNLADMQWQTVTTISDVSELSIMFDGIMKMVDGKVESYTTNDMPVIFYVDSSNSLKCWNMNTDVTFTISDTAYNVASVRGLYSEAASLDDGVFVFYTNASGQLWEARVLDDEVTELTQITLLPEGVTGWLDVWASLTFDYRVSLQLKGNDNNVYNLMSASRPSGFGAGTDYIAMTKAEVNGACGFIPPNIVSVDLISEINFGPVKTFKLVYDGPVYNVSNLDAPHLRLISSKETLLQQEYFPYLVEHGDVSEVVVYFNTVTMLLSDIVFSGNELILGSPNLGADNFEIILDISKVCGTYNENSGLSITESSVIGELIQTKYINFDVNALITVAKSECFGNLEILPIYTVTQYNYKHEQLTITNATSEGTLCDVNGIPI